MNRKITSSISLLFLLSTLLINKLSAQEIYYVDTSFSTFVPQALFGSIDLSACSDNLIEEELGYEFAYDIMVTPSGETYGYGVRNGWMDTVFFRNLLPPSSHNPYLDAITFNHNIQGLTCDENGYAYAAGRGITKLNSECCDWEETYLGNLPPGMECLGDITYREGKFYVSTIGNQLVEVDMKDPGNSQVVMDFPVGTLPIHGLATVQSGCDSIETYAIGRSPGYSEVYLIDFDTWTISLVCDMPELAIDGAGSQTECMLPPCGVFVDLDDDNSSFGFWGNHCADTFCLSGSPIADDDVLVLSGAGYLDSVTFVLSDILDTGEENLEATASPNIAVSGNGTTTLTLVDNGASLAGFEEAIKTVVYQNNAFVPTPGKRKVSVTAWADGEASPVSTAELPLFSSEISFEVESDMPACFGFSDGSITVDASGGVGPYGYEWAGGATGETLGNLSAGDYPLTITDAIGCALPAVISLEEPDTLTLDIAYSGLPAICDMSGTLTALPTGGTFPYAYDWSNSSADSINAGIGAGDYILNLTDANGCTAASAFSVGVGDTILTVQTGTICEGQDFEWQGISFSVDTLACLIFEMANGCDSTLCLDLTVNPAPDIQFDTIGSLCGGDEVIINAGQHESYLWTTGEDGPEITVETAGGYGVEVTDALGCTSESSIEIFPGFSFGVTTADPSCPGTEDGLIAVEGLTGGTSPFSFSLNTTTISSAGVFEGLTGGEYQFTVLDGSGCSQSETVVLDGGEGIFVDAGPDMVIDLGESVTLSAETNLLAPTIQWSPSTGLDATDLVEVMAMPLAPVTYTVEVTDSNGCSAMDNVSIDVNIKSEIYIPTAFSPNGDGTNDIFRLYTDSSIERIVVLKVYDRWGNLVFERNDVGPNSPESGWDGNFEGEPAQSGAFAVIAEVIRVDGVMEQIRGDVVLIR